MKALLFTALALAAPATTPAFAQTPSPSIEARLERIEAKLAIHRIIVDYAARLDAHDFAGYAALFAKDGTWANGNSVRKGAAEIQQMLLGLYGPTPPGFVNANSYHLVSNIEIDVAPDGQHATAHSRHLLVMRAQDGHPRPALAGRYEDEFIKEGGQWKILHRIDYPVMPTAEEWLKEMRPKGDDR